MKTFWINGLSGSGKSTLANKLYKKLSDKGHKCVVLDGDLTREGLCKDLGFSYEDRHENIRRVSEVNKILNTCGIITINAIICPLDSMRNTAKEIIGDDKFIGVYANASLETCIGRDPKGLYKKAIEGDIKEFTGVSSKFEEPKDYFYVDTNKEIAEKSVENLVTLV